MNSIYNIRIKFITIQIIVFVIAGTLMYLFELQGSVEYLFFYSIWNLISYIYLFVKELKCSNSFHIFTLLSLFASWYIGVNGLSMCNKIINGDSPKFGIYDLNQCVAKGVLFMALEHIILFGVFYYFEYKNRMKKKESLYTSIVSSHIDYKGFAKKNYIFVWIFRMINYFVDLSSIASILVRYTDVGYLITLFFLLFSYMRDGDKISLKMHWMVVAIEILLVINHGMKEEIIHTIIPYVVYMLIMYQIGREKINLFNILKISLLSFFVIGFVFPYVSIFRGIANESGREWSDITVEETINGYIEYISSSENNTEDKNRGLEYAMSRAGSIGCNSWSIDYTDKNGPTPEFFKYFLIAPIPRIIWRSKPSVVTGGMAYRLVTGNSDWLNPKYIKNKICSVSLGFIGSCIFCLGYIGGISLMVCLSIMVWYVWHNIELKIPNNIVAMWIFISLISTIYKDFENFQDCGVIFFFNNALLLFVMKKIKKTNLH